VDNIKMDLREISRVGMGWIDLADWREEWRALVNILMNFRVSLNTGKFLNRCATGGFSRRPRFHEIS
jgi:hypothetical protein